MATIAIVGCASQSLSNHKKETILNYTIHYHNHKQREKKSKYKM